MAGQGAPGKPRKKRTKDPAGKIPKSRATSIYAPIEMLDKLAAAKIPFKEAFVYGAAIKISEPGIRTLAAVDREILIIDRAILDFLEKKDKLLEERERLISEAIQEAETQKKEALE